MKTKDIQTNGSFGYYSPQGLIRVIYILIKAGFGFGKLKKIFAKTLSRINKTNPIDIIYHDVKFRLYPHNNTIESKMLVSSRLREANPILPGLLMTVICEDLNESRMISGLLLTKTIFEKLFC